MFELDVGQQTSHHRCHWTAVTAWPRQESLDRNLSMSQSARGGCSPPSCTRIVQSFDKSRRPRGSPSRVQYRHEGRRRYSLRQHPGDRATAEPIGGAHDLPYDRFAARDLMVDFPETMDGARKKDVTLVESSASGNA
ncbi:hypothetical protein MPTK1_2g18010 [Marchantia polymorpha subsp. ruderalis]|uniref:Uncharacterized protein n=2 Tax=Marchantia polymorpha TaxID=3197 RepID=A0A176WP17_MARPO|nr:hypothetical protein AXG93_400s1030 [Marchantia polymorpha subsp. ruderalis]PTQ32900.1 hypothetical protein MARPO_0094s0069 [Marchantia polymorpha]BBN02773.1 hypothetical protein Mp_2g18010 [Marchantia polymorpha subsp. ruderalis]|eukprot:PTQ32900.1 hypothetical protein MARPO_0094s0069 [Marchantia polymorpha]